ncbi:hypothetical protein FACS189418_0950 [Clostridia bacterium]|nr:hypothetical protein FACS189418_0950 [Clostridia bacterium]
MQSVILISESQIDFAQIEIQWKNKSISTNNIGSRFVIEIENGRIYLDLIKDGLSEYDDEELDNLAMSNYNFCSISYTDGAALKSFILGTLFSNKVFIDDDNGNIVPYLEFASHLGILR